MIRRNPFERHRFLREVVLRAVRWYCRYPFSYRDIWDMLAERGITVNAKGPSQATRRHERNCLHRRPLQRRGITSGDTGSFTYTLRMNAKVPYEETPLGRL